MGLYKNILVVGNGFDLALNLPTSYLDFMKFFLRFRAEQSNLPIPKPEENNKSKFYELFKSKMNSLKSSWNDKENSESFEEIILKNPFVLIMIFKYNKNELARAKEVNIQETTESIRFVGLRNLDVSKLSEQYFKEHDITGNNLNWFNVEEILHQIINKEDFTKISKTIERFKYSNKSLTNLYGTEEIFAEHDAYKEPYNYQKLISGLELFKKSLAIYLSSVESFFKEKFLENFQDVQKLFTDPNFDEIISLNYTSFAEKAFQKNQKPCHYPHGYISKKSPENSEIVLGCYEDITKNRFDTHFVEFQKFYQRILYGLGNYEVNSRADKDVLKNIEFFGFSCDPADTELVNALLLDANNKISNSIHKVVVHCYKNKNQNILNLIQCIGKDNVLELTHQSKLEFKLDSL